MRSYTYNYIDTYHRYDTQVLIIIGIISLILIIGVIIIIAKTPSEKGNKCSNCESPIPRKAHFCPICGQKRK